MIKEIVFVSFLILGSVLAYEDFTSRTVSVVFLLGLALLVVGYQVLNTPSFGYLCVANYLYLLILMGISTAFLYLKNGQSLREVIGVGDLVFLLVIAGLFEFPSFIIWLNVALVFSLVSHILLIKFSLNYRKQPMIPLIGLLVPIFHIALFIEFYVEPVSSYILQFAI